MGGRFRPWKAGRDPEAAEDAAPAKSKSAVKREFAALWPVVERLVALPPARLDGLDLPAALHEAVVGARTLQRGALQRQLRHAVGLLARADHVAILAALEALARPQRAAVEAQHEVEDWRTRLLAGDDELAAALRARYPSLAAAELETLVREARREQAAGAPPRAARRLYRRLMVLRGNG